MGALITAACACGFETDFTAGAGRSRHHDVCHAPAMCLSCKRFLVKNYLDAAPRCGHCGDMVCFYNNPRLQDRPAQAAENKRQQMFVLPDCACLCPTCGNKTLYFSSQGCWE